MSRNANDELPDDLLDKLRLLNEQPDDYDADTRPLKAWVSLIKPDNTRFPAASAVIGCVQCSS